MGQFTSVKEAKFFVCLFFSPYVPVHLVDTGGRRALFNASKFQVRKFSFANVEAHLCKYACAAFPETKKTMSIAA